MGIKADAGAYARNMKFLQELRNKFAQGYISHEEMIFLREQALSGNSDEAQIRLAIMVSERKNL